jgi:RecA/RadA recombinase
MAKKMMKFEKLGNFLKKAETAPKDRKIDIGFKTLDELEEISFIPTGNPLFDGTVGGFPRSRHSLLFGGASVGKSTFLAQSMGYQTSDALDLGICLIEPENRSDKRWMLKFIKGDRIYISQCTSLGDALDAVGHLAESGLVDACYVDSLAALAVKEMKGKGVEGDHMAIVARRMPQYFQIAVEPIAKSGMAVIMVHQKRDVLEMYSSELETYGGGNALKHNVSLVLNARRAATSKDPDKGERFKENGKKIGFMTNFKCIKGTVGTITEGQSIQLDFYHKSGFAGQGSTALFALRNKIIYKEGLSKYVFDDGNGQVSEVGMNKMITTITSSDELHTRVLNSCIKHMRSETEMETPTTEVEADTEFEKEVIEGTAHALKDEKAPETPEPTKKK